MKTGMLLTTGVALIAVAACSRGEESSSPNMPPGVKYNEQTGVVSTKQGLQANGLSAASACIAPGDMNRPPSAFPPEQRQQIVACLNGQMAAQVNPQLPRQIDEVTRLDRVEAVGPEVIYHYTLNRSASSLPADAGQRIEAGSRQMVCAQAAVRQMQQMGAVYSYRYVDNQGALIHQFRITC